MATGRHSHKHTHRVVDGNGHPIADHGHTIVEHEHDHEDGPTPDASRHHNYAEEPAVAVMGPITSGLWECAMDAASMTPRVYVSRGDQTEEVIAQVVRLSDSDGQDRSVANAKLLTFSPALLRFVQSLAAYDGVGIPDLAIKKWALALIEQLNQVEVRSDADRR